MCLMVYIAAHEALRKVDWVEAAPAFYVADLSPDERRVDSQFRTGNVVYAGSYEGYGCGFQYGEFRVIVAPEALAATQPFESEPVAEANVLADIAWATRCRRRSILHLHWIGCLPWGLPPRPIHVVEQVWTEIIQHAPEALAGPRLERENPAI